MINYRMLFTSSSILLCYIALLVVGCGKDYTGDLLPEPERVDEALDLLSEDEWDSMMSLPPLPYAPPPDFTDSDSKLSSEEPRQSEQPGRKEMKK